MAIFAAIFFREKINLLQLGGIIIAMFGLLLLVGKGNFASIDLIKNKGDLLVLGSAFTWGVYSTVNKKISLTYSPLDDREVIILKEFEDHTYKEIAEILNIPVGSVMSRLFYARKKLAAKLKRKV